MKGYHTECLIRVSGVEDYLLRSLWYAALFRICLKCLKCFHCLENEVQPWLLHDQSLSPICHNSLDKQQHFRIIWRHIALITTVVYCLAQTSQPASPALHTFNGWRIESYYILWLFRNNFVLHIIVELSNCCKSTTKTIHSHVDLVHIWQMVLIWPIGKYLEALLQ